MSGESLIHCDGDIKTSTSNNNNGSNVIVRRERPSRACTARSAARLAAAAAEADRRKHKSKRRPPRREIEVEEEEEQPPSPPNPYSKIVTQLVAEPPLSQLSRWSIRSMWELAAVLNFFNVSFQVFFFFSFKTGLKFYPSLIVFFSFCRFLGLF